MLGGGGGGGGGNEGAWTYVGKVLIYAIGSPRNDHSFPLGWFKEKKKLMIWRN